MFWSADLRANARDILAGGLIAVLIGYRLLGIVGS